MKRLLSFIALFVVCLYGNAWTFPAMTGSARNAQANEPVLRNVANMPPSAELEQIAKELGGARTYIVFCCPACEAEADKAFGIAISPIRSNIGLEKTNEFYAKGIQEAEHRIQTKKNLKQKCPNALQKFQIMCQKAGIECPNAKAAVD